MEEQIIIVGANLVGLLISNLLSQQNIEHVTLERRETFDEVEQELTKTTLFENKNPQSITTSFGLAKKDRNMLYLNDKIQVGSPAHSFYYFDEIDSEFLKIMELFKSSLILKKGALSIDPTTKTLRCLDGSSYTYSKLIWCADYHSLKNALKEVSPNIGNLSYDIDEQPGLIQWSLELKHLWKSPIDGLIFKYRYKDIKMTAFGTETAATLDQTVHYYMTWKSLVPSEVVEDKEETAKCIRAMKREITKEFPELKDLILREKISYSRYQEGLNPEMVKALLTPEGIVFLGKCPLKESISLEKMNSDNAVEVMHYFQRENLTSLQKSNSDMLS